MVDVDKLTNETIAQGGVLALLYFDLHATKKELLAQLGAAHVQKILSTEGVVYALGEIDEPMEEEGLYSTSVEVKVLTKDFPTLLNLCLNYSPLSVEILRPNELKITTEQMHRTLMDASSATYELRKFMMEKVFTGEDLEKLKKMLNAKIKLGEKILKKLKK